MVKKKKLKSVRNKLKVNYISLLIFIVSIIGILSFVWVYSNFLSDVPLLSPNPLNSSTIDKPCNAPEDCTLSLCEWCSPVSGSFGKGADKIKRTCQYQCKSGCNRCEEGKCIDTCDTLNCAGCGFNGECIPTTCIKGCQSCNGKGKCVDNCPGCKACGPNGCTDISRCSDSQTCQNGECIDAILDSNRENVLKDQDLVFTKV